MNANEIVAELGRRLGIGDISQDVEGRLALDTEEGLHIELQAAIDDPRVDFIAAIGTPRENNPKELMLDLLTANTTASGVCSPFFAFSRATREVVLSISFPVQLSMEAAESALQHLIERATYERNRLSNSLQAT
jgi:hypothetical protein